MLPCIKQSWRWRFSGSHKEAERALQESKFLIANHPSCLQSGPHHSRYVSLLQRLAPLPKMSAYREYVIETYLNSGEPSGSSVRARPMAGQGIPVTWKVDCSKSMRRTHPVGTKFLLLGRPAGGHLEAEFLYCNPRADYEVLSENEAIQFIRKHFATRT